MFVRYTGLFSLVALSLSDFGFSVIRTSKNELKRIFSFFTG